MALSPATQTPLAALPRLALLAFEAAVDTLGQPGCLLLDGGPKGVAENQRAGTLLGKLACIADLGVQRKHGARPGVVVG